MARKSDNNNRIAKTEEEATRRAVDARLGVPPVAAQWSADCAHVRRTDWKKTSNVWDELRTEANEDEHPNFADLQTRGGFVNWQRTRFQPEDDKPSSPPTHLEFARLFIGFMDGWPVDSALLSHLEQAVLLALTDPAAYRREYRVAKSAGRPKGKGTGWKTVEWVYQAKEKFPNLKFLRCDKSSPRKLWRSGDEAEATNVFEAAACLASGSKAGRPHLPAKTFEHAYERQSEEFTALTYKRLSDGTGIFMNEDGALFDELPPRDDGKPPGRPRGRLRRDSD